MMSQPHALYVGKEDHRDKYVPMKVIEDKNYSGVKTYMFFKVENI